MKQPRRGPIVTGVLRNRPGLWSLVLSGIVLPLVAGSVAAVAGPAAGAGPAIGAGPAAAVAGTPPSAETPRPCLVPAHPRKQGQPPRPGSTLRNPTRPLPMGGALGTYHADHLQGVRETASGHEPRALRAIVLLVDFEDQEMGSAFQAQTPDSTQLYFDRVMQFLDQMYTQMSDGLVSVDWTITAQVYRLPETMAYYGLDDSIATREAQLCQDAVQAADSDIDFSQYDTFMLFHAGPGQEADINDDSREQIWSVFFRQIDFTFWLDAPDADQGIRTNDTDPGTGGPFYVTHTVVLPETESQDGFEFGILGVVAHEFGHWFGLPDLYDTTAPEDFIFADSQGIGTFGLMGAGIWNADGVFPAEMCAWSKFYTGWLRPSVVLPTDGEQTVFLDAVITDRRQGAIRIPLGGDEYFLIENRIRDYNGNGEFDFDDTGEDGVFDFWTDSYQGAEFDWHLPQDLTGSSEAGIDGSGLLIWHVDESIVRDYLVYNLVNSEALHKGVDLEEADGIQDLDKLEFAFEAFGDFRDSFWAPNAAAFTPQTLPDTDGYNGAHSGIWITDISVPGPVMSFDLRFSSSSGDEPGDLRAGWPVDLPGLVEGWNPVTGDLDGNGVEEIVLATTDAAGFGGVIVLDAGGDSFFSPGSGPELLGSGRLRAAPILADMDAAPDGLPEVVWVTGDTVCVLRGDGTYITEDGTPSATPAPFYRLDGDPGPVQISAGNLDGGGLELLIGSPSPSLPESSRVLAIGLSSEPGQGSGVRAVLTYRGVTGLPHVMVDVDSVDGGLKEIASSVRTPEGGCLAVGLLREFPETGQPYETGAFLFCPGDSARFTAPVVGDLNGDGLEEIVVGDSRGYLHALAIRISTADGITKEFTPGTHVPDHDKFEALSGWPVFIGTLESDEVSLADVDGDGSLEVLAFGPGNSLHAINYNGTSILSLPAAIPAEDRFETPFLAPLVLDLDGVVGPDLLLPLPDGQIRGHDTRGQPLSGWAYLGGGDDRTYPVVTDLDGDGVLELVTVEDVTVEVPPDVLIQTGDEAAGIVKRGRVLVRRLGPGSGEGPWPVFRSDAMRSGRASTPTDERVDPSDLMVEVFVMPNPVVRSGSAGFHYRVRTEVERMTIQILSPSGQTVRTLTGSVFPGTDNLVPWDLTNDRGSTVAPGLYYGRFQAESGTNVQVEIEPFVLIH